MITKNLINQCEQAEEIQKAWKPKMGDWVSYNNTIQVLDTQPVYNEVMLYYNDLIINNAICDKKIEIHKHRITKDKMFYLPTQEQLQEMIKLKHDPYCGALLSKFYDWYNKNYISLESMNELWLAFVMKEKYNKIWTGEKWVKAE